MVDAHDYAPEKADDSAGRARMDYRKAMSDNVAIALLVYTALQIFVTVNAMKKGFPAILPYIGLAVLVAGIIPACRWFEKRWADLGDAAAHDPALKRAFRRDQAGLWAMAIGLPFLLTGLLSVLFG